MAGLLYACIHGNWLSNCSRCDEKLKKEKMMSESKFVESRTRLGEEAIKAVDLLSKALDNAMEANQERCSTAHKALQARDEALEDAYGEALQILDAERKERDQWKAAAEQLQVQLAGCSVAALGGTKEPAEKFSYGWSQALCRHESEFSFQSFRSISQQHEPAAAPRAGLYISYPEPDTETRVDLGPAQGIPGYMKEPVQVWKDNPKTTVLAEQTAECGLTVAEQVESLETRAKNHENWLNAAAEELNCDLDQVHRCVRDLKKKLKDERSCF